MVLSATSNPPAVSAEYELWCLVEGDRTPFPVTVPTGTHIAGLKELVFVKRKSILRDVDAADLKLWKVSASYQHKPTPLQAVADHPAVQSTRTCRSRRYSG
jgi:Crinkler effector protein N-terminal domain